MNKTFYLLLPVILVIGIYGSQTSNGLISGYFKPYAVKNSNDIFTISIDKSAYKPGQTINIFGKVNHYSEGTKVTIEIIGPDKSVVGNFDSLLDRFGIFTSYYNIPDAASNGKYILSAYYDGDPKQNQVYLTINISDNQNGVAYIFIPQGAATQDNKLNFDPPAVNVTQGTKIVWINKDATVHTVISGKVNEDGSLSMDNHFTGGYVTPGDKFVISPAPGKYNYFCKIHPWLGGSIIVTANPALAKTPLKPSTTAVKTNPSTTAVKTNPSTTAVKTNPSTTAVKTNPSTAKTNSTGTATAKTKPSTTSKPFPVSNNVLITIWRDRKDIQKLYPEVTHGNLTRLTKWATTKGWNEEKSLGALIPSGKVPDYVLTTIWKERKDLQKLYPEVAHGNLTSLTKWAKTTGWNQDKRLAALIPPAKVPDYVLTTIWKERKDLQKLYPEVAHGSMGNLTKWATKTGWDQDKRLAALIPPGKTPKY